ncbi:MAG: PilZ domain-containing protein [Myxococcales bacterium]
MGNDSDSAHHRPGADTTLPTFFPERRHSFRVQIPAHAGVWHKGRLCGYYGVRDLSISGCLLDGGGDGRAVGEQVELLLHLPRHNSVGITAVVRRVDGATMGLSFEHATPRAEDCIQDLVVEAFATLRAQAEGHVALVIEPNEATRRNLMQQLKALGQPSVAVATPLDAVQVLVEQGERVDFALIEAESLQLPSFELVEFLMQHHPHVRRVLIGDGDGLGQHWLSEASGEVHSMMELPCSNDALQRMLSRVRGLPNSQLS